MNKVNFNQWASTWSVAAAGYCSVWELYYLSSAFVGLAVFWFCDFLRDLLEKK